MPVRAPGIQTDPLPTYRAIDFSAPREEEEAGAGPHGAAPARPYGTLPVILTVKLVMSLATLVYAFGYAMRHRDNLLHRRAMALGFCLTLAIAAVLVIGVQGFGATYRPAYWLVEWLGGEQQARVVLLVHRGWATLSLLLLIAQVVSGVRRLPLHHRLYPFTIAAWIVSYVSGMFIFV